MSPTLSLAVELVRRASVTPEDGGCQAIIAGRLRTLGFEVEPLSFGQVTNLWARWGTDAPLLVLAGHTDVVPTGPADAWRHPPFAATIEDGLLHGRGAADMKGSLAAMLTACERFLATPARKWGSVAFLITSDEEGPAKDGTIRVVQYLAQRGETIDWCLIGEPSSTETLGDEIKNGRRGSLGGRLTVRGIQGHVAYPQRAENPIHRFAPALTELTQTTWDQGNETFPPTSFQVSNIHAGTGAGNVIPGELSVRFNFRYSTATTAAALRERVEAILTRHKLNYRLHWNLSGAPYVTPDGVLLRAIQEAVREIVGIEPRVTTTGGTSDGRFIAPTGAQVIEFGPVNNTIHKIDECVRTEDLDTLSTIYQRVLERLLLPQKVA